MKKTKIVSILLVLILGIFISGTFVFAQTKPAATSAKSSKSLPSNWCPGGVTTNITNPCGTKSPQCQSNHIVRNWCCAIKDSNNQILQITIPECSTGGLLGGQDSNIQDINCACCGDCKLSFIMKLAGRVMQYILWISGSLAMAMFVFGGMTWVLSAGKPEMVDKGRKALTGAVIGVIIVLGAYIAVDFTVKIVTGYDKSLKRGYNLKTIQEWGGANKP